MCIMTTERYIINLFGVDSKYYTNEYIAHIWEESANKEYQSSGIYVTALFETNILVCGEIRGCTLGDTAHIIRSTRNPTQDENENDYWNALRNVISEVRAMMGNPSMTITITRDIFHYFY